MPQRYTLPVGPLQTNSYLVWKDGSDRCVVIDPGEEPKKILQQASQLGKTIVGILLTHGHFDHVGAVRALVAQLQCPVYLCPEDSSMPAMFTAGPLYYTHSVQEGDVIDIAELSFSVLHTPGHTPGSVCYLCDDCLFCGDTLFAGSCGRTDLPGGSWQTMRLSLKRLRDLQQELQVYPGHGESTTLSAEKRFNPCLM